MPPFFPHFKKLITAVMSSLVLGTVTLDVQGFSA